MDGVRIRAAEEGDLERFAEMTYNSILTEKEMGVGRYVDDSVMLMKEVVRWVMECWVDMSCLMLVAEAYLETDEGGVAKEPEIVGILNGRLEKQCGTMKHDIVGTVDTTSVEMEWRRSDVATELQLIFEALAIREGVNRFEMFVYHKNVGPQRGLKKLGYAHDYVRLAKEVDGNPDSKGDQ